MVKTLISEYTEQDFLQFVKTIYHNDQNVFTTEESHSAAVLLFEQLCEHPDGMDLIYHPEEGRDDTPEAVVKQVKEWRAANGKAGFKQP